ncbi:exopolyphosphatase [Acetilactobacillus jinshanensis]|uniref:Exopolyphosphatase n=1 Tax=Acetilactobacillus jinshanensis TaxID=1720083 RepID=A0A4P6ZME0_9LACO|nr:exopolyphosphatase [Acetilactobacillus jinshanensis]QBP18888.1 exopolyphosphatase [Acetilactobacillus jinshanensis]URL60563.1 exopolyphosphatase [uncultured bacterium]
MKNLVIIDLGSNSIRMAINKRQPNGSFKEIKRLRNPVRLSHDMGPKKILQPTVMRHAIQALTQFHTIYSKFDDYKVIGIATAAVRQAQNQKTFLKMVYDAIGIHVKVLSGTEEAECDYLGVKDQIKAPRYVIMDVGGGSIEIIYVDHQSHHLISLPVGAVSITERYHLIDNVSGANLFGAQEYFHNWLKRVSWLRFVHHVPLILLGGAHRALARMNLERDSQPASALGGYSLSRKQIFKEYRHLLAMNLSQRKHVDGLETNRASVIIGGLLPLTMMMNHLDIDDVHFSNCGVRQGLIKHAIND